MPQNDNPMHTLTAELSVQELYVLLGTAWMHSATTVGLQCAANSRLAQACKLALRRAGEPSERIEQALANCLRELGVEPSR